MSARRRRATRRASRPAGQGMQQGVFSLFSSDHCPFRYDDPQGQARRRRAAPRFRWVPNGIPGVETRLPILFSEGVGKGRITLERVRGADRDQPRQDLRALSEARARSRSAPTPTSRSGTRTARSRSRSR